MRRIVTLPALAGLVVSGLLTAGAGPAAASSSAPAPDCTSYSSQLLCNADSPVSPVTWTQTQAVDGTIYTSTFSGPAFLQGGCSVGIRYGYSYSYVSGGVTYASPATYFYCSKLQPQ